MGGVFFQVWTPTRACFEAHLGILFLFKVAPLNRGRMFFNRKNAHEGLFKPISGFFHVLNFESPLMGGADFLNFQIVMGIFAE